jgi:hypothetical protein
MPRKVSALQCESKKFKDLFESEAEQAMVQ